MKRSPFLKPFPRFDLIPDPYMAESDVVPVKEHTRKPWMKGRHYHDRIQKKWIRRFGMKKLMNMYRVGRQIIAHPNNLDRLRQAFAEEG